MIKRMLFLLFSAVFIVGIASSSAIITGCSGSGTKEKKVEEPPAGTTVQEGSTETLTEGPKSKYLLYSASDGNDYELFLFNPALPVPADTPSAKGEAPPASYETIQLTSVQLLSS